MTTHTEGLKPPTREELIAFLNGSGPIDGIWYGDRHPVMPGMTLWWRKYLPILTEQASESIHNALIADTAIRFIDRMNDPDPIDPADKIIAEFVAAVMPFIDQRITAKRALSTTPAEPVASAPEGYVLVPIVPTRQMSDAGKHYMKGTEETLERQIALGVWSVMLAASTIQPKE